MSYPIYMLPIVLLLLYPLLSVVQQRARAEALASRVHTLLGNVKEKPLDMFDSHAGRKLLSLTLLLDRMEKKIRFLERHNGVSSLNLSRRLTPLNRMQDMDTRVAKLEGRHADISRSRAPAATGLS